VDVLLNRENLAIVNILKDHMAELCQASTGYGYSWQISELQPMRKMQQDVSPRLEGLNIPSHARQ